MRVLVVFVLGVSLAGGKLVSKCDLRDPLMAMMGSLIDERGRQEIPSLEDKVAKIVCYVEFASGFNTTAVNQLDLQSNEPKEVWTLYGLFQLSNHLVCSEDNDKDLSKNICEMNCNKLVDDVITDDIECLSTVLKAFLKDGWNNKEQLEMIKNIFLERCGDKTFLEYFSDCS